MGADSDCMLCEPDHFNHLSGQKSCFGCGGESFQSSRVRIRILRPSSNITLQTPSETLKLLKVVVQQWHTSLRLLHGSHVLIRFLDVTIYKTYILGRYNL